MKITTKLLSLSSLALVSAVAMSGCSGAGSSADAGDAATTDDATTTADGPQLFGLTPGDTCFDVLSIEGTTDDGCMIGVGDTSAMGFVGSAILVNYDMPNGKITLGKAGALGTGLIAQNMATLLRDGMTSDVTMATCMWNQKDTTMLTMTATNAFTIGVTEMQSMFTAAPGCTASSIPAGGMCTSKWTWKMKKGTKSPTTTPPCM